MNDGPTSFGLSHAQCLFLQPQLIFLLYPPTRQLPYSSVLLQIFSLLLVSRIYVWPEVGTIRSSGKMVFNLVRMSASTEDCISFAVRQWATGELMKRVMEN